MKKLLVILAAATIFLFGAYGQSMAAPMAFEDLWSLENGTSVFTITPMLAPGVYFYVWNGESRPQ